MEDTIYKVMKKKDKYVPFVSEVEEFNHTMGKQTIMSQQYPKKRNGSLYTTSSLKNLKNIKKPVKRETLLKFLMLYVTLPTFRWVTALCYMVLRIKYGQRIKKYKRQICQKLVLAKKRHKRPLGYVLKSKRKHVTMKRLETIILSIEHVIKK